MAFEKKLETELLRLPTTPFAINFGLLVCNSKSKLLVVLINPVKVPLIIEIYNNEFLDNKGCLSIIILALLIRGSVQMYIESICLTSRDLFVRCISNLPSASDKKLYFTL